MYILFIDVVTQRVKNNYYIPDRRNKILSFTLILLRTANEVSGYQGSLPDKTGTYSMQASMKECSEFFPTSATGA
jgi:hypothetical protein